MILPVEQALFYHSSLPFASVGSVWAYLRVADVLSFLAGSLLIVPGAHFVDDFYQSEDSEVAQSVRLFVFEDLPHQLGLQDDEAEKETPFQVAHFSRRLVDLSSRKSW